MSVGCVVAVDVGPVGAMGAVVAVAGAIDGKGVSVGRVSATGIDVATMGVIVGVPKAIVMFAPHPVMIRLDTASARMIARNIWGRMGVSLEK